MHLYFFCDMTCVLCFKQWPATFITVISLVLLRRHSIYYRINTALWLIKLMINKAYEWQTLLSHQFIIHKLLSSLGSASYSNIIEPLIAKSAPNWAKADDNVEALARIVTRFGDFNIGPENESSKILFCPFAKRDVLCFV